MSKIYFSANDLNFDITDVCKITRGKTIHQSHERKYSSLSIRLTGNSDFFFSDKTYAVSDRDVLYLPYATHYKQATENETIIAIHFIAYSNTTDSIEIYRFDDIKEVQKIFEDIYNIWKEKKQGYKYLCTSLFYKLIYMLNLQCEESTLTNSIYHKIKPACDYIHKHYKSEEISISSLAKMSYMSETAFRKSFKKIYFVSPNKYIRLLRLENAYGLLQSYNYKIFDVAALSGFNDTKYFSREFKKRYGISPKEHQLKYFPNTKKGDA